MHRSRIAALASMAALIATTVACADETKMLAVSEDAHLISQLVALGFRPDMIEDEDDYFLVEGDIRISKAAVPRLAAAPPLSTLDVLRQKQDRTQGLRPNLQWRTDVIVGQSQVQNVVADLSGLASQPAWQKSARQALTEWNRINCTGVHFVEGSPGDITFSLYADPSQPGTVARAEFPADAPTGSGKPGPTVQVNESFAYTPNDSLTKLRNMVHEIGHTIGYRHTNWRGRETQYPYGANLIPSTPDSDNASVMNGGTALVRWAGFSAYDQQATKTLYPGGCLDVVLSGPGQVQPYATCTWTASPSGGHSPYTYYWNGVPSSSATYRYRNPGVDFTIRVVVVDAFGRQDAAQQNVRVYWYGPYC